MAWPSKEQIKAKKAQEQMMQQIVPPDVQPAPAIAPSAIIEPKPKEQTRMEMLLSMTAKQLENEFRNTTGQAKEEVAQAYSRVTQHYYKDYPRVMGGNCEYCGVPYWECEHYKGYAQKGKFRCVCGASEQAVHQLVLLYVPHRQAFFCDSYGCKNQYFTQFKGFEPKLVYHFWKTEFGNMGPLVRPSVGNLLPETS